MRVWMGEWEDLQHFILSSKTMNYCEERLLNNDVILFIVKPKRLCKLLMEGKEVQQTGNKDRSGNKFYQQDKTTSLRIVIKWFNWSKLSLHVVYQSSSAIYNGQKWRGGFQSTVARVMSTFKKYLR